MPKCQAFADHNAVHTVILLAGVTFFGWMHLSNNRRTASRYVPSPRPGRGVSLTTAFLSSSRVLALFVSMHPWQASPVLGLARRTESWSMGDARSRQVVKTRTVTEGKLTVASITWALASELGEKQSYNATKMDGATLQTTMTADDVTRRGAVIAMLSATESRSERSLAKEVAIWGKDVLSINKPDTSVDAFKNIRGEGVHMLPHADLRRHPVARSDPPPVLALALADAPKRSSTRTICVLQEIGIEVNL
ncbi:hypothetical protein EI94DRAFT_1813719 [Lactarius quietus]|nr:hypothetical protein EI94DRAFT_1813719 [Lactarius quietus]